MIKMITIDDVKYYTENGIIVHPLTRPISGDKSTGKAPILSEWQTRTEPYDENDFKKWLKQGYNIGANCGKASNLTAIDIDYYIKGIWDYVFSGIDTSNFVIQRRTERDGKKHYLFQYSPALKTCTNQELGFDIRNDGGNIVLAPSTHYEGDVYKINAPIENRPELPEIAAKRINKIISTYAQLKLIFAECRKPFQKLWKAVFTDESSDLYRDKDVFRHGDGRARHLSLFAELLVNGATNEQLKLACMLIFGEDYDEEKTIKDIRGIKKKPARTTTLLADEYYSRFMPKTESNCDHAPVYPSDASEAQPQYRTITEDELATMKNTRDSLRLNLDLPEDHFITQFVEWSDSLNDGYREYKIVTAFWLLSALVQRKVYSRWSTGIIYPNIWAFLIGPSTISRKTTVIDNGRDIYISATGNKIPDTDYSLEGYAETLVENPILNCVRDEVSTLLSKMGQKYNDGYFEFECSMYDGKPYVKTLASKGKGAPQSFVVENTYITKLYATTPVKLSQSLDTKSFDSGFGFRFLFANPCYNRELKGHRRLTDEDTQKWASIMERTRKIYNFFKETPEIAFEIEPEAEKFYSEKTLEILNKLANEEYSNDTLLAVWGRLETYIIKLAMLIEIGKKPMSLTITLESLVTAFSMVCNYFVPSTISVYNQLLEDTRFNNIEKILAELRKMRGAAAHRDLLRYSKLVAKDFNECIETMHESGAIEIVYTKTKNNREAKTYLLKNENANIIPKDVFDIGKVIQTLQIPRVHQVHQVHEFTNVNVNPVNLVSVKNIKQLDRAFKEENDSDHSPNTIDDATTQYKNPHAHQIHSPQDIMSERVNLVNLVNSRNLRSSEEIIECTEEELAKILREEGF
jgi:hypothetical protein